MIKKKGDLFTTTSHYIGHGVNTKGVMGAGIAKEFKARFPQMFEDYKGRCKTGKLTGGGFMWYLEKDQKDGVLKMVHNIASQTEPGSNAKLEYLAASAYDAALNCIYWANRHNYPAILAIPKIGCGIGGLVWEDVEPILLAVETLMCGEFEFEVWEL